MDLRVTPSCLESTSALHPCFYALTSHFSSISRYNQSHTVADKQDSNPNFSTTHFHLSNDPFPGFFQVSK